ncbi:MAG: ornithine carbamoyltransferase [Clostridia bacterium]|nr:ornithine carbamoyltransferase [Clostridia bacterium]
MKDLLKISDLNKEEILSILDLADKLKYEKQNGIEHKHLSGKTLGMIFKKASTRTRVSFETGMYQLGGYALFLQENVMQIGRGEPTKDTARVLSRYVDGIMIRTFEQEEVETLAKFSDVPVINGLTDFAHPCQVLADLMTIREYKNDFDNLTMCYIGDGNNMANSLIVGALKVGMNIHIACPKGYEPDSEVLDFAQSFGDKFMLTEDPLVAAQGVDVVYTDVWSSMGDEENAEERAKAFQGIYQVNEDLMSHTDDAIILHCLPAHREEEITNESFEKHAKEIFDEAENRLHAQKAVMVSLMK